MAMDTKAFVAVVGGFFSLDSSDRENAKETAREIGAALARAGFGLVVYFSNENSLEPHVVNGFVGALDPGSAVGAIRVRYPESQRGQVEFPEEKTHGEVFNPRIFPGHDWEEPFYRSLVEEEGVDAVLLIAGGQSTLIAGHIALARDLPILAIDTYPGSARVIWAELSRASPDYPSAVRREPDELVAVLSKGCEARTLDRAEASRKEHIYARVTSETAKRTWTAVTLVALLVILFFGIARPPNPSLYSFLMFIGLIAAGATGTLVRALLWGPGETPASTSLLLGSIAGLVVGLAYLVPQFVGAPGVLEVTAVAVQATDKIQFVSAVLVAISAGIGFDTVFTRLRENATDVPISANR